MTRKQKLTLTAAILGSAISILDGSVVSVALPAIERDLGGGLPAQQWVTNAYLLSLGSLILLGGSLGDIFGPRRIFTVGAATFASVSLVCAAAPSIWFLVAARAAQGVAGALLVPSSLAIIVAAFPVAARGPAVGMWTAWAGVASVVGPLVGGLIVDFASWRLVFLLSAPLAGLTIALVRKALPSSSVERRAPVDLPGAVFCVGGLGFLVYGLIEQSRLGFRSPVVLAALAVGLVLLSVLTLIETRTTNPMLDLSLFRASNFTVGNVETFLMYGGLGISFFFLVIFLQEAADYSAVAAGLATLPVTLVMFSLSRRVGALADRFGPRLFMGFGPLISAAGLVLLARIDQRAAYWTEVFPGIALFSVGLVITVAPLTAAVLAAAPGGEAGVASAVNNAVARLAGLVAVAATSGFIAARLPNETFGRNEASVHALHSALLVAGALLGLAGGIGLFGIRNSRDGPASTECPDGQLVGGPLQAAIER